MALVNNGTEETKGNALTQEAYQVLKDNPKIPFVGNIEGNGVLTEDVDVLVCDGFTGNIVLKTCEGAAKGLFKALKDTISTSTRYKLGALLLKPGLKEIMGNTIRRPLAARRCSVSTGSASSATATATEKRLPTAFAWLHSV